MSIVVNQNVQPVAIQGVTAHLVLQPGSVVNARVVQTLGNNQVRIAIAGQSIDVTSQVPLQAGQTLQLAVSQTDDTIRLAVVSPQTGASGSSSGDLIPVDPSVANPNATNPTAAGAGPTGSSATSPNSASPNSASLSSASPNLAGLSPASPSSADFISSAGPLDTVTLAPSITAGLAAQSAPTLVTAPTNQLTPQQALAVSAAAQGAATQQTSLAPLFANLSVAAGLNNLPPQVQQAVTQLLAQRTNLDQNLTGADLKQAFQNSGLFLEANLASGSAPSAAAPDLKAALIVLRQVLTASLNGAPTAPSATVPQGATVSQGAPLAPGATVPQASTAAQGAAVVQGAPVAQGAAPQSVVVQNAAPTAAALALGAELEIPGSTQPLTVANTSPGSAAGLSQPAPPLAPQAGPSLSLEASTLPILEQVVVDFSAPAAATAPAATAADAAALAADTTTALSLLQQALQAGPQLALNPGTAFEDSLMLSLLPALTGRRMQTVDDAELARSNIPPPPVSGALPAAQPVIAAKLVSNSPSETAMHHLIADTEGALARQTLLQVASLPNNADGAVARPDLGGPRWNFEIPFATSQGTAVAQFEISRDGGGNQVDAAKQVWRARFSLDVEPAGPVHALISLNGGTTSVRMWAQRPATAAQLRAGASQLTQALWRAELTPGDIVIRDGAPPQPAPAPVGHFLDRAL